MMNFYEINKAYKETGIKNFLLECLSSTDNNIKAIAMREVAKKNFQSVADVKMYVALNA